MKNTPAALPTYTLLVLRYMSPTVSLEAVVKDFFPQMSMVIAKRKAVTQELPFPVLRMGEGNKAAWMVNLADLAVYIDRQTALAQHDHKAMNGGQYAH